MVFYTIQMALFAQIVEDVVVPVEVPRDSFYVHTVLAREVPVGCRV